MVVPREAFAIKHAFVVPGAEGEGSEGAEDIAEDIVGVEYPAVLEVKGVRRLGAIFGLGWTTYWQEALEDFRADPEDGGADYECEICGAPPGGVEHPVEAYLAPLAGG